MSDEPNYWRLNPRVQLHRSEVPPDCLDLDQEDPETDGEDCGGSGPARSLNPHRHSHPNADDEKASESSETEVMNGDWQEPLSDSGPESEDRDNVWKETRAPESAAHALKYKEALVSHVGCNTGNKSNDSQPRMLMRDFSESSETEVINVYWEEPSSDSGPESEDGDNVLTKTRAPESAAHDLTYKEALVSHVGCDTANKSNDSQPKVLTREKPFSFDLCGKRFNVQGHLKKHMRVSCDVCGRRFTQQGNLKRHMKVHTKGKPFSCDVCMKTFKAQVYLKAHMRVHT